MDACLPPTSMSMHHHGYCPASTNSAAASPSYYISFTGSAGRSTAHFHFRSNFNRIRASVSHSYYHPFPSFPRAWSTRCHARSPGPPPPPKLEPPSGESSSPSSSSSGALSTFSQVQDAVRIFFAVLFWMSLFFWSCIWDGNNSGRQGKGPRFRR